ncbi:hypothetical protein PVK06_034480 [Gossypium arboreum]|uniref:DUF7745 domain-containing protein n=1 Tax=Gossypium arboreum TaxID=29729 RepID=A0ABR0NF65_GOSAR|nr:hypothetical protein PVK06_034480 [Gossypium arboreum]
MIFPKALGYIDEEVSDLFDRLDKGVTPVPAILAETFRSLNACRRNYSLLKEIAATPRKDDISEENWILLLQNLQEEDIKWRAPWLVPDEIIFRYGSFDWVPLLEIWRAVGYAPLLVLRGVNYKKKIKEVSSAWNQTRRMKRVTAGLMTTPEYDGCSFRVRNHKTGLRKEKFKVREKDRTIGGRKDAFEVRCRYLENRGREVKKGKKEGRRGLRQFEDRLQEVSDVDENCWIGKDIRASLVEGQDEKQMLVAQVDELEKALHQRRGRDFDVELRANLSRIKDLKAKVEELESALQNCELQIEFLESNNE